MKRTACGPRRCAMPRRRTELVPQCSRSWAWTPDAAWRWQRASRLLLELAAQAVTTEMKVGTKEDGDGSARSRLCTGLDGASGRDADRRATDRTGTRLRPAAGLDPARGTHL